MPKCKAVGCDVPGCVVHVCFRCGTRDSNHRSANCPTPSRCKVKSCSEKHLKHYCKNCGAKDSDHRSNDCPSAPVSARLTCKAPGCDEDHSTHICRLCENAGIPSAQDSDHRISSCPQRHNAIVYHGTKHSSKAGIEANGFRVSAPTIS